MAPKIGCVPQTLLGWVQCQEIDSGMRDGVTTADAAWFNNYRLLEPIGYIPPAEAEADLLPATRQSSRRGGGLT